MYIIVINVQISDNSHYFSNKYLYFSITTSFFFSAPPDLRQIPQQNYIFQALPHKVHLGCSPSL